MHDMTSRTRWLLVVLGVIALLAAAAWALRAPAAPATELTAGSLVRSLQVSARVSAPARVDVGATVTGRIVAVEVRAGDAVKAGAPLVRLETQESEAVLAQALAAQRQAQARLQGLRSGGRSAAMAALQQAQANLAAAQADGQRTADLVAQGFLSPARLDESRRAVAVAQAQLDTARTQTEGLADAGSDLAQARAQLDAAQASVTAAQARRAQMLITAPTDARVLIREAEPGQIVQPGRVLLSLALQGPLELIALVDERYLNQLRVGQAAAVVADAYPGQRLPARLLAIAPVVDAQRGAVEVRLALLQPAPEFLRNDMTLSLEIETGRREQALTLPLAALRPHSDGGDHVLVVVDGRAQTRRVSLGLRTLQLAEVTAGLQAGDTVLLGSNVSPGMRVRPDLPAGRALLAAARAGEDAGTSMMNAMGR
jgi:HlyD family secretion protein